MKRNMGSTDKMIRLVIAAIIVFMFATNIIAGTLGIILLVVAVVLAATSLLGRCPLYCPLGINTYKKTEE